MIRPLLAGLLAISALTASAWGVEFPELAGTYLPDFDETLALYKLKLADDKDGSVAEVLKHLEDAKPEFASAKLIMEPASITMVVVRNGNESMRIAPVTRIANEDGTLVVTTEGETRVSDTGNPVRVAQDPPKVIIWRLTQRPPLLLLDSEGKTICLRRQAK